jgi:hypothetical protein
VGLPIDELGGRDLACPHQSGDLHAACC